MEDWDKQRVQNWLKSLPRISLDQIRVKAVTGAFSAYCGLDLLGLSLVEIIELLEKTSLDPTLTRLVAKEIYESRDLHQGKQALNSLMK